MTVDLEFGRLIEEPWTNREGWFTAGGLGAVWQAGAVTDKGKPVECLMIVTGSAELKAPFRKGDEVTMIVRGDTGFALHRPDEAFWPVRPSKSA